MPTFLTEAEFSETFGISRQTLKNWRHRHQGPPYYDLSSGGQRTMIRYNVDEVTEWVANRRIGGGLSD